MANILAIDDKRDVHLNLDERVLLPEEVTQADVEWADLILVDFVLEAWTDVHARQRQNVATCPLDGLALAMVVRRATARPEVEKPVGVAVLTGDMRLLADPLPHVNRNHILAQANNLEWVFDKESGELPRQVQALAEAIRELPPVWPNENEEALSRLAELIQVRPEQTLILRDCLDKGAPLAELSRWSHGLQVIRWLLHRVLPYPSLLLSIEYLAAEVGVTPDSLENSLSQNGALAEFFQSAAYTGILSAFAGSKWWKAQIDEQFRRVDIDRVQEDRYDYLRKMDDSLCASPKDLFSVIVDETLSPTYEQERISQSLALYPDDWPRDCAIPRSTHARVNESDFLKSLLLAKAYDGTL